MRQSKAIQLSQVISRLARLGRRGRLEPRLGRSRRDAGTVLVQVRQRTSLSQYSEDYFVARRAFASERNPSEMSSPADNMPSPLRVGGGFTNCMRHATPDGGSSLAGWGLEGEAS
jgi:hypothetical protein